LSLCSQPSSCGCSALPLKRGNGSAISKPTSTDVEVSFQPYSSVESFYETIASQSPGANFPTLS
jgi:hypothetical protein